jgi:hypothetical protein
MNAIKRSTATAYAVYNADGKIIRVWTDESLALIDARGMGLGKDGVGYHDILLVYIDGQWWPCFQDKPITKDAICWENADEDQVRLAKTLSKLTEEDLEILQVK